MRWTHWSFFGGRSDDESPRWGHSPRMSGGSGVKFLSQILSDKSLSYSMNHISTGEHSLHISWRSTHSLYLYFLFSRWRHEMEICSALLTLCAGIHRSLVNSPNPGKGQWRGALMFSWICAWPNGWVKNQDSGDLRRCRAHYDVIVMWYRIGIQWSGYHAFLAHCSTLITIPWN